MTAIVSHGAALERSAQAPQDGRLCRGCLDAADLVDTRRNMDSTSRETEVPRSRAYRLAPSTTARSTLNVSFCIRINYHRLYVYRQPPYPSASDAERL
jgi:hypothetical protein